MPTRRTLLLGAGAAVALAAAGCSPAAKQGPGRRFVSGATDPAGKHHVAAFDSLGQLHFSTPIDFRAHEMAIAPDRQSVVVVARRPGRELVRLRLDDGAVVGKATAAPGRHFFGHGIHTADGGFLLTSENDFEQQRGVITVRDATTLAAISEFDSHGIGPHEMRWLADQRTLAVANGGYGMHPDYGRTSLGVAQMRPSLTFVDTLDGRLLEEVRPLEQFNSVRHIDVLADDRVVVAMQYQGEDGRDVPLVAVSADQPLLSQVDMPIAPLRQLAQYTADVCVDRATGHAVATCPRGSRVTFWDAARGEYRGSIRLPDAAGVCVDEAAEQFVVTSGRGTIYRVDTRALELLPQHTVRVAGLSWDNHVALV
ncbi:MAG: DUF1513 domain-containing protein [Pseudomonadota bacterium]